MAIAPAAGKASYSCPMIMFSGSGTERLASVQLFAANPSPGPMRPICNK